MRRPSRRPTVVVRTKAAILFAGRSTPRPLPNPQPTTGKTSEYSMSKPVHEIEFTSQVAGWINELINVQSNDFPLSSAHIEHRSRTSAKRNDLTVFDRNGLPCLTGEVKLPWAPDGQSPFQESVVQDARNKAQRAGVSWFFTWNVNELLLWNTDTVNKLGGSRTVDRYWLSNIQRPQDLQNPKLLGQIKDGICRFIIYFARTIDGTHEPERRTPDIYFTHSLESFLERPIQITYYSLLTRYSDERLRPAIQSWMRDRQGWTLSDNIEELIERAARFTNYTVVTRLIFYEALRKRFPDLPPLELPEDLNSSDELLNRLKAYFDEAKHVTGDYETVFGLDLNDIGDRIPFYDTSVIDSWRLLAEHVHHFDFSKLDYDVIGQIFEVLIGPEERHKYGQYYTRPEVVDLINSFCINDPSASVFDPGCGGGTFLVRAYARKRHLSPRLKHIDILTRLFGTDVSNFATHLTTINLAARDLVDAENYPRVARSDFMKVTPEKPLFEVPNSKGNNTKVNIGSVDAIVGNPPYVRQEDIAQKEKKEYKNILQKEAGLSATGRSDLHIFFWGHAYSFLKQDGILGFLTSSQWLDVEYGFPLQKFLLDKFRIIAVIESAVEPWFVGARVQTAITIAQRSDDRRVRDDNLVRFVQVRRPLSDLLVHDGTSSGIMAATDQLRDKILAAETDTADASFRIRTVPQSELREDGVRVGRILKAEESYTGSKWGIHLRAPSMWKNLQEENDANWRLFGELAEIRRGITTGADKFFYLNDQSNSALENASTEEQFSYIYGTSRGSVASGHVAIAKNGFDEVWPIEREYLHPIVHSLMDIDHFEVAQSQCRALALLVGQPRDILKGKFVEAYLKRGEQLRIDQGSTCKSRLRWYDLTFARRAWLLWAKSHQYRHCAPINPRLFLANCNLYTVEVGEYSEIAAGVLNSTIIVFAKHLYGRPVGVEANLKTEVVDVNMMPVPDWTKASEKTKARIESSFRKMRARKVESFLSPARRAAANLKKKGKEAEISYYSEITELDKKDRHELDDAVLELIGVKDKKARRQYIKEIYSYMSELFEQSRSKEEQAILNKAAAKKQVRITPKDLAGDVFAIIVREHSELLEGYREISRRLVRGTTEGLYIPKDGKAELIDDMVSSGIIFRKNGRVIKEIWTQTTVHAKLIKNIFQMGEGGRHHFVPKNLDDTRECADALFMLLQKREETARQLVSERTADLEMQEKAVELILARFGSN